ncbi:hypothetical protein B0J14DRAFT_49551 [Halenospora varia]|nr:hypothetical protein B0J14DRAFT_49551 [Halenospora varia]
MTTAISETTTAGPPPASLDEQNLLMATSNSSTSRRTRKHPVGAQKKIPVNTSREVLDNTFLVRNLDYKTFFHVGRIFLTLWTEQLGATSSPSTSVSEVVFGEKVLSKIRRFVVVRDNDRFCTCLPITSYGKGNKKAGTDLVDQGIIYCQEQPQDNFEVMKSSVQACVAKDSNFGASVINYARTYTIEKNVKVKDGGEIHPDFTAVLLANFHEVFSSTGNIIPGVAMALHHDSHQTELSNNLKFQEGLRQEFPPGICYMEALRMNSSMTAGKEMSSMATIKSLLTHQFCPPGVNCRDVDSAAPSDARQLDPRFVIISKPPRFFKLGRVFKVLWTEPAGGTAKDMGHFFYTRVNYNEIVYSKIRRFVVVRERTHSCLCLPLYTYSGQGASKADIRVQDHALVYDSSKEDSKGPTEQGLEKDPFPIVVEDPEESIDAMTRMNFAQVYTIQHNVKVAKIGRIAKDHLGRLDEYFVESIVSTGRAPSSGPS